MSRSPRRAYIGLGSNLDDPIAQVRQGIARLGALPSTSCLRASSLYRTAPWGNVQQPPFVNAVAELESELDAPALMAALLAIESAAGRTRTQERWGPRRLDLDLLWYDGIELDVPGLRLPHPHLHERAFVLLPLAELAPALQVPQHGRVEHLLAGVDRAGCEKIDQATA